MYADLTELQIQKLIESFDGYKTFSSGDDAANIVMQAANQILIRTNRGLNGKLGANAFAASLAVLVMAKKIKVEVV